MSELVSSYFEIDLSSAWPGPDCGEEPEGALKSVVRVY
jgi:hypothetical protein